MYDLDEFGIKGRCSNLSNAGMKILETMVVTNSEKFLSGEKG